jgi:alpha-glucosidase (family GH31 glycosyl hydrolase)
MLRRSIAAGLNFTASGAPYWDIGGYAPRNLFRLSPPTGIWPATRTQ